MIVVLVVLAEACGELGVGDLACAAHVVCELRHGHGLDELDRFGAEAAGPPQLLE